MEEREITQSHVVQTVANPMYGGAVVCKYVECGRQHEADGDTKEERAEHGNVCARSRCIPTVYLNEYWDWQQVEHGRAEDVGKYVYYAD